MLLLINKADNAVFEDLNNIKDYTDTKRNNYVAPNLELTK